MTLLVDDQVFSAANTNNNPKTLDKDIGVSAINIDTRHRDFRGLKDVTDDPVAVLVDGSLGDVNDVGFVYTPSTGDDTPFQLELPTHNEGDAVFVWARGTSAPGIAKIRNSIGTDLLTLTSIHQESPSIGNGWHLMWGSLPAGAYEVYGSAGTAQIGIHVYRGVTGIGDVQTNPETLDNFGADIPALTLTETDGTSRVWCGVIFNQLKAGASEPNTPTGLTKRLTSPSTLGGGTGVSYDTTDGVAAFAGARVDAFGGAYYVAWAVELIAGPVSNPEPPDPDTTTTNLAQQAWIYRMGRETPSDQEFWLSSDQDGDAARSLLASDPTERTYITGAGFDKPVYTDNTFLDYPPYPRGSYDLGIPAPGAGMALALGSGGSGLTETRAYVSTFVRGNGDEGPPSDAVLIDCPAGSTINITGLPAIPGGNNSNITHRRVYVSTGGDFQRINSTDIAVATTTATDNSTYRGAILQTGGSTRKPAWIAPPDDGKGIIELWAGMHGMWRGKQYLLCVPYNPHGWPGEYRRQVPDTIVGSAKYGQNWVLATTGIPRVVMGTSPSAMVDAPINSSQSCVSKRSVVGVGHGVCWAGPKGLSYHGQRGTMMITEGILTPEQWDAIAPETIIGAHWGAWYIGFYDNGTKAGFMINTLDPRGVIWLTQGAHAVFNDPINSALYILDDDNLVLKWDTGSLLQATFKSKVKRIPRGTNPGAARIIATTYPVSFSLWADGSLKVNGRTVSNDDGFRLPGGYTAEELQYQIVGAGPVEGVFIGEEMVDLP